MWNEQHQFYGYLSDIRTSNPGDSSTFHPNSLAMSAGFSITHSASPGSTFAQPMNGSHATAFPSDASLLAPHAHPDETNRAEMSTITQGHRPVDSDDGVDDAVAPTSNRKSGKKRKAADMEILTGKPLVDTYSKRSQNLIEKCMELEKLTGAYVVIYTARPESIADGRYRLHVSDNLREGGSNLMKEISGAVDAIEAASKAVHLSRPDIRRRKRVCTGDGTSHNRSAQAPSSPGNPDAGSTHARATLNTVAASTPSNVPVDAGIASGIPEDTGTMSATFEKGEIPSLVHLLNNDSRDVQLCGLAIIQKVVVSDSGVQAVHDGNVIPHLVELLERSSGSDNDVACQVALVLSRISEYPSPCRTMATAGVIASLSHLLSLSISDSMLAVVAKTIGQCAIHQKYLRAFSSLFPRDVLRPLINLLQSNGTEVLIAAAGAINDITSPGGEVLRYLLEEDVIPQLCHLASKCTDLLALEKVASAIGLITSFRVYDRRDDSDIKCYVLRPLLDLLGHGKNEVQVGAIRALNMLGRRFLLMLLWGESIVLPQIIPLISSDNDQLFVEALLCAWRWTDDDDDDDKGPPEYLTSLDNLPRLIRLLSCNKDGVVECAARAMGRIFVSCNGEFVQKLVDLGGAPLFVGLLSSKNMAVLRAAARALGYFFCWDVYNFANQGAIPALVNALALAFDSFSVVEAIISAISWALSRQEELEDSGSGQTQPNVREELIRAGAIPYFVRLLYLEDYRIDLLVRCVFHMVKFSRTAQLVLLNAGAAKALTRLVSTTPPHSQSHGIEVILFFACLSHKSRMEIQEAGAETVLLAYLAYSDPEYYDESAREQATEALRLLRSDTAGQAGIQ